MNPTATNEDTLPQPAELAEPSKEELSKLAGPISQDEDLYECNKCRQVFIGEPWIVFPPSYTSADGLHTALCRGCGEPGWPDPAVAYDEDVGECK